MQALAALPPIDCVFGCPTIGEFAEMQREWRRVAERVHMYGESSVRIMSPSEMRAGLRDQHSEDNCGCAQESLAVPPGGDFRVYFGPGRLRPLYLRTNSELNAWGDHQHRLCTPYSRR